MKIEDVEAEQSKPIQAEAATPASSAKSARSNFWDSLRDGVAKAIGNYLVYLFLIIFSCVFLYFFPSKCSFLGISAVCKSIGIDTTGVATIGSSPTPHTQMIPQKYETSALSRPQCLRQSTRITVKPTADVPSLERFVTRRLESELAKQGYSHVGYIPAELIIEIQKVGLESQSVTSTMWRATATVSVIIHWAGQSPSRLREVSVDSESQEEDSARTEALNNLIYKFISDLREIVLSDG